MRRLLGTINLKRFQAFTLVSFNSLVVLAVVNGVLPNKKDVVRSRPPRWSVKYDEFAPGQRREIKGDFCAHTVEYAPFLVYTAKPFSGKWLHLTPQSFRRTSDNECWPPDPKDLNIFVFGASSTMGVGVTDDQTIPAYMREPLQENIGKKVRVYNFGQTSYFSTQERIQFSHMMASGIRPDVAVFICGATDFGHHDDEPSYLTRLQELMEQRGSNPLVTTRRFLNHLPLAKLAMRARQSLDKRGTNQELPDQEQSGSISDKQIEDIIHRYLENKRQVEAVAAVYKVKTLFVWQPSSNYKFDQKYNPYVPNIKREPGESPSYIEMAKMRKAKPEQFGSNFLWLADMQKDATEPLYVDAGHYRPKFCKAIAAEIARRLLRQTLIADAPQAVRSSVR